MQIASRAPSGIAHRPSCHQPRSIARSHRFVVCAERSSKSQGETGSEPSTSGSNNSNDEGNRRGNNLLRSLLARLPKSVPDISASLSSLRTQLANTPKAIWILLGFLAIAAGRGFFMGNQRPVPREVRRVCADERCACLGLNKMLGPPSIATTKQNMLPYCITAQI